MSENIAAIFRKANKAAKELELRSRLIKPDCDSSANYHTVSESTVMVQGKQATTWVCNSPDCKVEIDSVGLAEQHVASTVDTPDINMLLSMTDITEQERYVLKYANWYIVYGKDRKVQRMLRRPRPVFFLR